LAYFYINYPAKIRKINYELKIKIDTDRFFALQGLHTPAPSNAWGSANNTRHTNSQGDALGWDILGFQPD
jgi:hypothetical protein